MHACVSPDISSLCWFASSQQGSSSDRWVAVVSGICRHVENLILSHYTKYYIISRYIMVIYFLLFYCLLTHPMDGKTCYYKSNNRQLQDASWAHVRVRMMSSQTQAPGSSVGSLAPDRQWQGSSYLASFVLFSLAQSPVGAGTDPALLHGPIIISALHCSELVVTICSTACSVWFLVISFWHL